MTAHTLAPPPPTARGSISERTLDAEHLAAMRRTRAALHEAARRADVAAIEGALAPFVHAMWTADFARQTICSLVAAAIDAGLPTGRGATRRAQRAQALADWVTRADRIADELERRG